MLRHPFHQRVIDGLKKLPSDDLEQIARSLDALTNMLDVEDLDVE